VFLSAATPSLIAAELVRDRHLEAMCKAALNYCGR
jgi:hypothetical protein